MYFGRLVPFGAGPRGTLGFDVGSAELDPAGVPVGAALALSDGDGAGALLVAEAVAEGSGGSGAVADGTGLGVRSLAGPGPEEPPRAITVTMTPRNAATPIAATTLSVALRSGGSGGISMRSDGGGGLSVREGGSVWGGAGNTAPDGVSVLNAADR